MGGRTNYPDFSNSDGFGGPEYFEDLELWVDPLIGETVDTVAHLPIASLCWPGRTVYVNADPTLTNIGTYVRSADNTTWILVATPVASTPIATFGTNWTAGTGSQTPKVQLNGNRVDLTGTVLFGASGGSYANILTVPAAYQPPSASTRPIGTSMTSAGLAFGLWLSAGVIGSAAGYSTGSLGFSTRITLNSFWYMD